MQKFDNMNLTQLLNLVDNNFYQKIRNPSEFLDYLHTVYNKSCNRAGIFNNLSRFSIHELDEDEYGVFYPEANLMVLNKLLIDKFDKYKASNNLFYPYILITTVLHESRHFSQQNIKSNVDYFIKDFALFSKYLVKYTEGIDYRTNMLEVDARYYAYKIMKSNKFLHQFQNHKSYMRKEIKASKGYSSIYSAILLAYSGFARNNEACENKVLIENLEKDCYEFMHENNIDAKDFWNTIYQLKIREGHVAKLRPRPTELKLVDAFQKPAEEKLLNQINTQKVMPYDELIKYRDGVYALNARPPIVQKSYFVVRYNAYRALETMKLYERTAPEFALFDSLIEYAPKAPQDEIDFVKDRN